MGEVHGKLVFFLILDKLELFLREVCGNTGCKFEHFIKAGKDF